MNKQIKNYITLTLAVCLQFHGADTIIPMQRTRRAIIEQYRVIAKANSQLIKGHDTGAGEGGILGLIFAGCVPLASQNPYPIIVVCILWPVVDPILDTFGQICKFRDPN